MEKLSSAFFTLLTTLAFVLTLIIASNHHATSAIRILKPGKPIIEESSFDNSFKIQYAKEGTNYKLKCKTNLENTITFWTIDHEVPEEPKYKFLPDMNLLIRNVSQDDFLKEYFCHSIQQGKTTVESMQIELKPRREMKSLNPEENQNSRSKTIYAIVGELKVLPCTVQARPYPDFKWLYRNGTLIQNKTDFIISSLEDVSNLTIFMRNSDYYGEYICEAWNNLGRTEQTFFLKMPEKPTEIPFIFPKSLGTTKIILGIQFDKSKNYTVHIQYKSNEYSEWTENSDASYDDETVTIMDLQPNTTYLIRAAVKSQFILGDYSDPIIVTTDKPPYSYKGLNDESGRKGRGRKLNLTAEQDGKDLVINSTIWTSTKVTKQGTKMYITRTTVEEMDDDHFD